MSPSAALTNSQSDTADIVKQALGFLLHGRYTRARGYKSCFNIPLRGHSAAGCRLSWFRGVPRGIKSHPVHTDRHSGQTGPGTYRSVCL